MSPSSAFPLFPENTVHARKLTSLAACLGIALTAAPVSAITYDCTLNTGLDFGKIRPRIVLKLNDTQSSDAYIYLAQGAPIPVDYTRKSDLQHQFDWTYRDFKTGNVSYTISYTAQVDPRSLNVTLTGKLHGWSNRIRGHGTCRKS